MIRYFTFLGAAIAATLVQLVALLQGHEWATLLMGVVALYWTFKAAGEIHKAYS